VGCAIGRRTSRCGRDGGIHQFRIVGLAHGARAAASTHHRHDTQARDRTPAALVWGVNAVLCHDVMDVPEMTELALATAVKLHFAASGQTVVIAAGMPFGSPGTTNLLRIAQLE
jgi:pyruvate kinase